MFLVNNTTEGALAKLDAVEIFQTTDQAAIEDRFKNFLEKFVPDVNHTIFISGENGDRRSLPDYATCEYAIGSSIPVVRYKHLTGEYPTASSFAVWLACQALQLQWLPDHFYKNEHNLTQIGRVVIYNQYQRKQHSFMLISKVL